MGGRRGGPGGPGGRVGPLPRLAAVLLLAVAAATAHTAAGSAGPGLDASACPDDCSGNGVCFSGSCVCNAGYGGESCALSLATLGRRGEGAAGAGEGARTIDLDALAFGEAGGEAGGDAPVGALAFDPLGGGGAAEPAQAEAAVVPPHLKNMLLYAEHLSASGVTHFSAMEQSRRALLGADEDEFVGCGFYDVFYEGCSACFYSDVPCEAEPAFYDFYDGFIPHPPTVEYSESFADASAFGARANATDVVWGGPFAAATTPKGDAYLGGLSSADALTMAIGDLPASSAKVTLSLDVIVTEDALDGFSMQVLGAGAAVAPDSLLKMPTYLLGSPHYQVTFTVDYAATDMKVKFLAAVDGGATWGIDNLEVTSLVADHDPVVESRVVMATPDTATTIELRGSDAECQNTTFTVTSLPTEGTLYLCTCDDIWTTAITAEMLPAVVPGPCQRVVYAPTPNAPASGFDLASTFDTFGFRAAAGARVSRPGTVDIYMTSTDAVPTPVAGIASFAAAFDGQDDVVSISETPSTLAALGTAFSVEARFRVIGDAGEATLVARAGAYRLGWTKTTGLTFTVHTAGGAREAAANLAFADGAYHYVAAVYTGTKVCLFVDGALAAEAAFPAVAAVAETTAGILLGGGTEKGGSAFRGVLDEFRAWTVALAPAAVAGFHRGAPPAPAAAGLLCYIPFKDGAAASPYAYDLTAHRNDAQLGVLGADGMTTGVVAEMPTFVASGAVFGNVFETAEDEPLEIQLHGGDADGGVTFVIATLPTKGFLYADGANVTHTPFELHGTSVVEYVPDYNANGAPMDIFKYQAYNGVEFSYRQGVVINVIPVNDAPTASDVAVTFDSDAMADGIKAVRLLASDVEGDALAFVITGLPERGSLFQAASVSPPVPGAEITALGTEVADADGYVLFVPLANGHDSAAGAYDSFKFVASDGQARSAEGVATVNVADDGIVQPVAGNAGYALLFDGSGTEATLGALKDYGVAGDFSLSLWFKTYASGDMVLLAAAPFTLEFTKGHGLQFSMAGSTVTHSLKYNDGSWHNVVASYSAAGGVCLLVDAGAKACGPADGAPAYDSALVLGKGPESHFLGQVDEVAVFDYEVAASFGYLDLASRDLASPSYVLGGVQVDVAKAPHVAHPPVAYFKFNEATGAVVYEEFTAATGSLGDGAVPATQPSWIQSTMPIPDYVKVDEGMNVTLDLAVASEDGLTYGACIITQPAHGQLYYIGPDGAPAHALPQTSQPVSLGGTKVVYNSGDGAYGAGAGLFKYFGGDCDMYFYGVGLFYMDGEENAVHKSKTVDFVVDVQHVNHAPTACAGSVCAGVDLPYSIVEPVLLALEGEDLDGDNLTVALVHVPEHGALTDADGAVLEAGSTTSDSVLYYLPHVDATGADVDKVVYTISDGNFVTEPSALAISITDSAAGARPVAGESGYALSFDGDADYAELGTAAALGVAAGFQVGFFLKAREYAPGATVLALDGVSLHWTAAKGLVLATGGGATAVSGLFLNDGQWHHVLVSVGAAGASLIVDGAAFEAAGLAAAPAFNASLPLTLGAAAETDGTGFQGLIDEVSVWDTSVAAADVISLAGSGYPLPVTTAGLKAYYRLNEAGGAALACAVAACADGTLPAAVASQPARATSNLGLTSPTVEVAEGASVSVTLPALSESDGMYLRLNATSKGAALENAKGKALKAGSSFTGPLTFVSALGKTGLFTVTYYAVNLAGESTAAEFSFNVTRANLVPEVDDVAAAVDFTDASNVELVLSGYDPNGDALTYVVESLPEFGVLYAAVDAHGVGEGRVAISQALTGASLYYFPQLNADATSDAFSYTATDGELTSTVGTVTLTAGAAVTEVAPAAGQAGFALEFDGADDIVTLGTLADYSVAGTLELSAFFKTHGSVSGDMVLLEAGDLTVGFSAALGLYFKAGADLLPSFLPCNDGAWHSVAAVYSPGLLSLAVDGELATAPAAAAVDLAGTSVVYVGNSAAAQSHMGFNGAVDDVAVGNGASVTGLYYFNEKDGNALANEVAGGAAGVLGRAGAGSPTRVVSTMPSTVFTVTVAEDAEATFDLVGQVLDTDATAVFVVTRLPAGGTLYSVSASGKEKEVKSVPTALPGARVVFVPAENAHAAAGASSLTYVTENSANANYKSFPSTVHIEVTPVYERPTVSTPAAVTTERNTPVVVSFASADGDTAAAQLVHTLTSLPTVGKLLYADGRPVTEAPATIPADSLAMTYIPPPNAVGSPLVTLGFSVTDGNLTSEEGSVAVNVVGGSPAVFTDVTTEDYALPVVLKGLAFDGIDDVVASSLALKPRTSYTLAAAFKTAAFTGEEMALVDFGSTVVGWNKVEGLFVAVGNARDASFEMFNDGLWHSVELNIDYQLPWNGVAAFGTYAVSVSVDGTTVASLADLAIAGPAGDGFTLGKAAGLKHFSGAIDEVTVLEAGVKVVHYSMDETSSALVPDTSGHGNHATMAGVAVTTDVVYIHSFQNGFEGEYQAQELTVAEDGALTFDFVVTDGAIDSLAFQLVALPTHGKLYSGAGAAELAGQPVYHPITDSFLRYEPHPDFVGEDKLVYKVADPIGNGTLAELGALEVKFTVTPSNDPPTLAPAAATTGKGVAVVLDLATGSDIDSTALAYTVSSLPVHGVLYEHDPAAPNGLGAALAAPGPTSGAVVYVPEPGFVGADRVGVRVSDGEFTSDEALATVTVTGDGAIAATGPAGFALALDGAAVKFPLQQEDVSDFTAEFWVKTAAAVSQELPVFSVGNVEVTLAMFGMVKLGVDGEATFSPTAVNNGQWNHLAVVADQIAVTLYLNGAQALTRPRGNAVINKDGQGDEVTLGAFTGTVDEVRVWSTPKTPAALAAAMHSHVPCRAGTVGLVGCLDFNSAADLGKYNLVVSTAPITVFDVATDEDVAVNFELLGPAGDGFLITSLPAKGSLTVGGVPITTVPYSLPQRLLTFAPVPNEYGAGYAEVGYVTKIGSTFSAEAFASISVASVNDPPTALPVAPVAAAPGAAVKVELQATDIDTAHGQVAFSISHMPLYGWLYQAGADGAIDLASPIADDGAAAVTAVSADGDTFTATVFYVPEDYLFTKPPTFQYDAKFVFAASDGEASAEAEVTVGIDQSPVSGTTAAPVKLSLPKSLGISTVAGQAIVFDSTYAIAGRACGASLGYPALDAMPALTLELFLRTTATPAEEVKLVDKPDMYSLVLNPVQGLVFRAFGQAQAVVGGTTAGSTMTVACAAACPVNNGVWHHVAVTLDDALGKIYIDGVLMGEASAAALGGLASSASVLTVAPASPLAASFQGFMDEVRIWSTAKTEAAVVTQMHLSLAAAEPGLEAYYQFNYPAGVTSAVADSSANGLDACLLGGAAEVPTVITPYAAPVYMQDVAVKEDEAVAVALPAYTVDAGALDIFITELPAKGELFDQGSKIVATPYKLSTPNPAVVTYQGAPHENGAGYASFGFAASDGVSMSAEAHVKVNVVAVNYPPVFDETAPLTTSLGVPVAVTVSATDLDVEDVLTYHLRELPLLGFVQAADGNVAGAPHALAAGADGTVTFTYVPIAGAKLAAKEFKDTVVVAVSDGTVESLQTVEITVDHADSLPPLIAGVTGNAALFTGMQTMTVLGSGALLDDAFTWAAWIKSSEGGQLMGSSGMALSIQDSGAVAFTSAFTPEVVVAGLNVLDEEWHHVALSADLTARKITIYVDGMSRTEVAIPANVRGPLVAFDVTVGGGFAGLLDEVALFSSAVAPNVATTYAVGGSLVAYLQFNQASLDGGAADTIGASGGGSFAGLVPDLVASSVPLAPPPVATGQEAAVAVVLYGDVAKGLSETFVVTELPTKGALSVGGVAIASVPYALPAGVGLVTYTPAIGVFWTEVADYSDTFGYTTTDGATYGAEATVTVGVTPCLACVNTAPVAAAGAPTAVASYADVVVSLAAADADGDSLVYRIVSVPAQGALFSSPGRVQLYPGDVLGGPEVVYSPLGADGKGPMAADQAFTWSAADAFASSEATESLTSAIPAGARTPPVAGSAGYAVMAAGATDTVSAPALKFGPAPALAPATDTVEFSAKFRTGAAGAMNVVSLQGTMADGGALGSYTVSLDAAGKVIVSVTSNDFAISFQSTAAVADDRWHELAVVLDLMDDFGVVKLMLDGSEEASRGLSMPEASALVPKEVSVQLSGADAFVGVVDDVALAVDGATVLAFAFNEAAGGVAYDTAAGGAAPISLSLPTAQWEWVVSGAPPTDSAVVPEGAARVVALGASAAGGAVAVIDSLPSVGELAQVDGEAIVQVPTVVKDPRGRVTFRAPAAAGAASFAFHAVDFQGEASGGTTFAVTVAAAHRAPEVQVEATTFATRANEGVLLQLGAKAFGGTLETPALLVKGLPLLGSLYQVGVDGGQGSKILLGGAVTSPAGLVLYVPHVNAVGADTLAVAAFDGVKESAPVALTVQVAANYYASFTGGVECLKLGDLPEPPYSVEFMLNMNPADATGPVGLELANAFPAPAKDGAFAVLEARGVAQADVQDGKWHHVAATFDGTVKKVYIDGRLDSAGPSFAVGGGPHPFELGLAGTGTDFITYLVDAVAPDTLKLGGFAGQVDEVRVWSTLRSAEEIRALGTAPVPATAPGLHYYEAFGADSACGTLNLISAPVAGEDSFAAVCGEPSATWTLTDEAFEAPDAFTVQAWAQWTVAGGTILSKPGVFQLGHDTMGGLMFAVTGKDGVTTQTAYVNGRPTDSFGDGAWHMLTGVFSKGTLSLYVDGELVAAGQAVDDAEVAPRVAPTLMCPGGTGAVFTGRVDEVSFYDAARGSGSIAAQYKDATSVSQDGLLYPFTKFTETALVSLFQFDTMGTSLVDSVTGQVAGSLLIGPSEETKYVKDFYTVSTVDINRKLPVEDGTAACLGLKGASLTEGAEMTLRLRAVPARGRLFATSDCETRGAEVFAMSTFTLSAGGGGVKVLYVPGPMGDLPAGDAFGVIAYTVGDGLSMSQEEVVPVIRIAANVAPVAKATAVTVTRGESTAVVLDAVDPDGGYLTAFFAAPLLGTLSGDAVEQARPLQGSDADFPVVAVAGAGGQVTFTYTSDLTGVDTFKYYVTDNAGGKSQVATVTVTVLDANLATEVEMPTSMQAYAATDVVAPIFIKDSDVYISGGQLEVTVEVAHGSLSLSGAASAASRKLALAGAPHTLNAQLGHLFYHRSDAHDFDTLTVVVTGDNGESLAKAMTIVIAKASSEVKEFRFAGDANSVLLTLGEGAPAVAGCADLFADLSKLIGASCTKEGVDQVVIGLGPQSTLRPGDALALKYADGAPTFSVNAPLAASTPQALITGPLTFSQCVPSVTLSGKFSDAIRPQYLWTPLASSAPLPKKVLAAVINALDRGDVGDLTLLTADFEAIELSLVVRDALGGVSAPATVALTKLPYTAPALAVSPGTRVEIGEGAPLELAVDASLDGLEECLDAGASLRYAWTVEPGKLAEADYSVLTGPTFKVAAGKIYYKDQPYHFNIEVTICDAASPPGGCTAVGTASLAIVVHVKAPQVRAFLAGGAERLVTVLRPFELDASKSFTPTANPLSYIWACTPPAGAACPAALEDASEATVALPANAFTPGVYTFAVTVFDPLDDAVGQSTAAQAVTFTAIDIPPILLAGPEGKVNPEDGVEVSTLLPASAAGAIAYEWQLSAAAGSPPALAAHVAALDPRAPGPSYKSTLTGTASAGEDLSFYLAGGSLVPGEYDVALSVTDSVWSVAATYRLVVNSPPTTGSLSIEPGAGVELQTAFTLVASGFADEDAPIAYRFSYETAAGKLVPLTQPAFTRTATVQLPASAKAIAVTATDTFGAATTSKVEVGTGVVISSFAESAATEAEFTAGLATVLTNIQDLIAAGDTEQAITVATVAVAALNGARPATAAELSQRISLREELIASMLATIEVATASESQKTQVMEALAVGLEEPREVSVAAVRQITQFVTSAIPFEPVSPSFLDATSGLIASAVEADVLRASGGRRRLLQVSDDIFEWFLATQEGLLIAGARGVGNGVAVTTEQDIFRATVMKVTAARLLESGAQVGSANLPAGLGGDLAGLAAAADVYVSQLTFTDFDPYQGELGLSSFPGALALRAGVDGSSNGAAVAVVAGASPIQVALRRMAPLPADSKALCAAITGTTVTQGADPMVAMNGLLCTFDAAPAVYGSVDVPLTSPPPPSPPPPSPPPPPPPAVTAPAPEDGGDDLAAGLGGGLGGAAALALIVVGYVLSRRAKAKAVREEMTTSSEEGEPLEAQSVGLSMSAPAAGDVRTSAGIEE